MIETFRNIFKIQELRDRILFTLGILVVVRIGGHIVIPGVNSEALAEYFKEVENTLFGLYDLFAGGAFSKATVFALGIMPYISSSIILQLLGAVIPYFQRLQKEGEEGRKRIIQYTRYGTVLISAGQSFGVAIYLQSIPASRGGLEAVYDKGAGFVILTVLVLTAGTILLMWLGERITERGVGNGISLIIFIGIVARFPNALLDQFQQLQSGERTILAFAVLIGMGFAITAAVVAMTQATRKIPVQYAKRVIGRKVYGGQSTHIPLKVNTAGVMPIIFAQSITFIPSTFLTFFPENETMQFLAGFFGIDSVVYWIFEGILIVFFTYFYTAIALNPVDVADNMKKYGGFIPGIRPGKKTSEFIDEILTRVTLPGAIFLALITVIPYFVMKFNIPYSFASFFGGTSLLIIVGVALDTLQQIESHLLMRHYDGFLKSGRIKGRR
jgi:preprotein translocase subunit SecY